MDGSGSGDDDQLMVGVVGAKLKEKNFLRGIAPASRVNPFTTGTYRSSGGSRFEMTLETVISSRSGNHHGHQREKPYADAALFLPPDSPQPSYNDDMLQSENQQQQMSQQQQQHGGVVNGGGRQASPPEKVVLSARFNQDYGCFACGTETGFRVYSCHPFSETFRREFDSSGIGLVEMLFRCNIIALVGGGKAPKYSPNKVMIWDDHQGRCIGELTFRSEVRSVRLRRDYIVVVLEHKIYAYGLSDLVSVDSIETLANPKGLCVISYATNSYVLVCPGQRRGQVLVKLYSLNQTQVIQAHDSALACFGLTWDGSILATASTKGTLIRIFNTHDGTKLQELRRGADRADIYSIAFSSNTQWLVVSSDKGTVHVFSLKKTDLTRSGDGQRGLNSNSGSLMMAGSALLSFATSNAGSSLSFMKGVLPKYFSSEWSFAQFHVPEDAYAIAAFGPEKNTIVLVCANGSFYRCSFDPVQGGEMVQQQHERFMTPDAEETVLPLRL